MYKKVGKSGPTPESFEWPKNCQLSPENRWVIMANLIPWSEFEAEYAMNFSDERGAPALPFRMALGALIIKEKLGISDRETVEQIKENPYLQYFIGLKSYNNQAPFDPSMLVHFRERLSVDVIKRMNEQLFKETREHTIEEAEKKTELLSKEKQVENRGKLIIDATCTKRGYQLPQGLKSIESSQNSHGKNNRYSV